MKILKILKQRIENLIFLKKISSSVIVEKKVIIGNDCTFEGHNRIAYKTQIFNTHLGEATYIGKESRLFNTQIGKYSCIGPRVIVIRGEHPLNFVSMHPAFYSIKKQAGFTFCQSQKFEEMRYVDTEKNVSIKIGNDVWIAADCRILEGVTIGNGAAVLAGAVVTKDVPPYAIVGGVPAQIVKYRFNQEQIDDLLQIEWWNWDSSMLREKCEQFTNIESFIADVKTGD